jgi:enoyl-CoA hydratase
MTDGQIIVCKDGHVGRLIIDNVDHHNALSPQMARQIPAALADLAADPLIRVLVITGAGARAFSSGADIAQSPDRADTSAGMETLQFVRQFRKPTIASIRGYCLGAGVALACACDQRICTADAVFSIPSARVGLAYRVDFTRWLVEAVGAPNAKQMLFTGQRYTAQEAFRIGLVQHMVSPGDLDESVTALCQTITLNAPLAIAASKAIINELSAGVGGADLVSCERMAAACEVSDDYAEGRRASIDKRKATFQGR